MTYSLANIAAVAVRANLRNSEESKAKPPNFSARVIFSRGISCSSSPLATIALSCSLAMAISMTARNTVESMLKSYIALAFTFVGTFLVFLVVLNYTNATERAPAPGVGGGPTTGGARQTSCP